MLEIVHCSGPSFKDEIIIYSGQNQVSGPTKHCPGLPDKNRKLLGVNKMTGRDCLLINQEILLVPDLLLMILCYTKGIETIK